jgi:hypothetical protein
MADTITQILGNVTAYSDAVAAGYTGTREQFATDQANFAANAQEVADNLATSQTVLTAVNTAAEASTVQASKSESYSIGGTGTRPGEDEDNSKHYSEVAQSASESAATSAGAALLAKQASETARDEAQEYAESIYLWQKAPTLATMDFAIMLYPPALASI